MNGIDWTVIATAVVTLIGGAAAVYMKLSGQWHSQAKDTRELDHKERREVVDELRELLEEKCKECHELRNELQIKTLESMNCQIERSRMLERMMSQEDLLEKNGIPFRRWQSTGSSPSVDTQG